MCEWRHKSVWKINSLSRKTCPFFPSSRCARPSQDRHLLSFARKSFKNQILFGETFVIFFAPVESLSRFFLFSFFSTTRNKKKSNELLDDWMCLDSVDFSSPYIKIRPASTKRAANAQEMGRKQAGIMRIMLSFVPSTLSKQWMITEAPAALHFRIAYVQCV